MPPRDREWHELKWTADPCCKSLGPAHAYCVCGWVAEYNGHDTTDQWQQFLEHLKSLPENR